VLASFISGDRAAHWGARSLKERRSAVLADLVTFFGPQAASPLEYNEGNWPSNPWEGGAYAAYFTPGAWTEYGHYLRAPVGRIFWAGTETAKKWAVSALLEFGW
jgi:monoamine oxidase